MSEIVLSVNELRTWYDSARGPVPVLDGVSFDVQRGETFVLLGESGCGKSMTALSIMRLLPTQFQNNISGSVNFDGIDLLRLPEVAMRRMRGRRIAMIFQEPMTSLNPVLTVGAQIMEVLVQHSSLRGASARAEAVRLLDAAGLPAAQQRLDEYPHQLSGGMKQRVMIAIALAGKPDLLIADEPTTALDVTIQAQVLDLLKSLQKDFGMAMLMITHDLGVVAQMADHVAVMYAGEVVEQAARADFFKSPQHPYSQRLFEALPALGKRGRELSVIPGTVPLLDQAFNGCRFAPRCHRAWEACEQHAPAWVTLPAGRGLRCLLADNTWSAHAPAAPPAPPVVVHDAPTHTSGDADLLVVRELKVHFPILKGLLKRAAGYVYAVDGVSFSIASGKTLALVGESGCGKTTVGKAILQLLSPVQGQVNFAGIALNGLRGESLRKRRREFQIIFQDPFSSMNPRMMVGDIIAEGMRAQGVEKDQQKRGARIDQLLEHVGLRSDAKTRYPHEFSGGQRQRICIARALAVEPKLIVCDEPTSALDVSVQAQILNLLKQLQGQHGLSYLFITHNISVVAYLAHEVAVMYLGRIVEHGPVEQILSAPRHPYTQALLSAVPTLDQDIKRVVLRLDGDPPSPINPPQGCHFHLRCPHVHAPCRERYPDATTFGASTVRCFLYNDAPASA
ncbi:MAG: ABC transporter ATP-binding protein [Gammaproteobacteria bacterium]|nr:ABC transporter ATP-binding protein [Gammaproteobacteria bacterium]